MAAAATAAAATTAATTATATVTTATATVTTGHLQLRAMATAMRRGGAICGLMRRETQMAAAFGARHWHLSRNGGNAIGTTRDGRFLFEEQTSLVVIVVK